MGEWLQGGSIPPRPLTINNQLNQIKMYYKSATKKVRLTNQESEDLFYTSLCNGGEYICGYGIELDYSNFDYEIAKSKLKSFCYEDVLMQILRDGGELKIVDRECDGEYNESITLKDVHDKVQETPIEHLMDAINENDDACTADVILQTVFYGEVIFG